MKINKLKASDTMSKFDLNALCSDLIPDHILNTQRFSESALERAYTLSRFINASYIPDAIYVKHEVKSIHRSDDKYVTIHDSDGTEKILPIPYNEVISYFYGNKEWPKDFVIVNVRNNICVKSTSQVKANYWPASSAKLHAAITFILSYILIRDYNLDHHRIECIDSRIPRWIVEGKYARIFNMDRIKKEIYVTKEDVTNTNISDSDVIEFLINCVLTAQGGKEFKLLSNFLFDMDAANLDFDLGYRKFQLECMGNLYTYKVSCDMRVWGMDKLMRAGEVCN